MRRKRERRALKQVDSYVAEACSFSARWLRDCALAAGLLEPTYSILGYSGKSGPCEMTFAEHLQPISYLYVFDTDVFIKNVFSNYLRLRKSDRSKLFTATVPAVIWELERLANDKSKPREELSFHATGSLKGILQAWILGRKT